MTMKENRPIRLEYCNKLEKKEEEKVDIFPLYFPLVIIFPPPYLFYYFPLFSILSIGSDRSIDVNSHLFSTTTTIRYDDDYST